MPATVSFLILIYFFVSVYWKNTLESFSKPLLLGCITALILLFYKGNDFLPVESRFQLFCLLWILLFLVITPFFLVSNLLFAIADEEFISYRSKIICRIASYSCIVINWWLGFDLIFYLEKNG